MEIPERLRATIDARVDDSAEFIECRLDHGIADCTIEMFGNIRIKIKAIRQDTGGYKITGVNLESAPKLISRNYYLCISWQDKDVTDKILKMGFYKRVSGSDKRKDKTDFYEKYLDLDDCWPMFAFSGMWNGLSTVTPPTEVVVQRQWNWLRKFMMFFDKDILELRIPRDQCVLGTHHLLKLVDSGYLKDDIECVTNHFEIDWLSAVHREITPDKFECIYGKPEILFMTNEFGESTGDTSVFT